MGEGEADPAVDAAPPRYRAFISYSHADKHAARRLHRALEAYRLPRRLIGTPSPRGPVPARLAPIFRDREDLPAGDDLSRAVRRAIADAGALIVLCSPAARGSPWVAREIALFRALHPDRPVLAAIIAGEPAEAFPPPLHEGGIEPLAADLRRQCDGWRLGTLKLVAGLLALDLDRLVQRDAQRHIRRVTAVTLLAFAAMLAMALLTLVALRARDEAERQRAEAEGLVEFMLTDLRERLQGVGRLDVLTAVNERALGYYAAQDLARLPADSLDRRAKALVAMGEDDERRGALGRARAEFDEAARTTAALLAAEPHEPKRIFAHAQSEYWQGLLAWRGYRYAAAQAGFGRYAALIRRLVAAEPANPEWIKEAGYAESNLGMLLLRGIGDAPAAAQRFAAALARFEAVARLDPGDAAAAWEVADAQAWLADARRAEGDYRAARAARAAQAALLAALLAADPANAVYQRDRLGNMLGIAQIDLDAGRARAAAAGLGQALAEADRLAAVDPADDKLAKQRLAIALFLARALLTDGAADTARALLAGCTTAPRLRDDEIDAFCAILTSHLRRREGDRAAARAALAAPALVRQLRLGARSARWGIDLRRERETALRLIDKRR